MEPIGGGPDPTDEPTDERVVEWAQVTLERTGVASVTEATHTLFAVLDAMGEILTRDETEAIARELPDALATALRRASSRASVPPDDAALGVFVHGVEWRENLPASFAFEHASAVCGLLAERLSPDTRRHLMADLPRAVAALLTPRGRPPRPRPRDRSAPAATQRDTLATGREGSRHPLSEARPETAHAASVVRSDNPHGETKISSSRGLTQERLDDSLATAHPGPARKVSDSH